ncbi:PQQ-dependent sugar dehydrogenase [Natronospirillum operosum]|uniref:PQQ-dependent sugar dehydrogenase n=1 Tax=Natronospirillum operosum TaxID=2759953 RepID=A0A4Z0WA25_9GAMM|nr:PQQ-dependent sugar dehydrogenase [Natronospirillum operosum]TGG92416.1 PQQ-dependent sugar dehydrogenase [Natronospirillum operosum]
MSQGDQWLRHAAGAAVLTSLLLAGCAATPDVAVDYADIPASEFEIDFIVEDLDHAWGMAILPAPYADWALVTERPGRLSLVHLDTGEQRAVAGTPEVVAEEQGGLLDVLVWDEPDSERLWVYLTWSGANPDQPEQSATHTGRAQLDPDAPALHDLEVLNVATPWDTETAHYGSRMVVGADDHLYISQGDRRQRDEAQDLSSHWGKTLRLRMDGSIPDDNPFVDDLDALDAIYTYGHRNVQAMAVEPVTGLIWQGEHGERNGDEINVIDQPGGNYGWPIATYGRDYVFRTPIGDTPPDRDDTVNPIYFWTADNYDDDVEGFPPSGMAFYQGSAFADWQGQLLMGSLWHQYLGRFERDDRAIRFEHRMLRDQGWRVRDVNVHPATGYIYLLIDAEDAPLVRVRPRR